MDVLATFLYDRVHIYSQFKLVHVLSWVLNVISGALYYQFDQTRTGLLWLNPLSPLPIHILDSPQLPDSHFNARQFRLHFHFVDTLLTHWGRDKMSAISQTTLSNAFSWLKMLEFRLKFQWSLFPRVQLTIFKHWFRWWLDADQATSHYLNQWWLDHGRIYASLGLNELMTTQLGMCFGMVSVHWRKRFQISDKFNLDCSGHTNIGCCEVDKFVSRLASPIFWMKTGFSMIILTIYEHWTYVHMHNANLNACCYHCTALSE